MWTDSMRDDALGQLPGFVGLIKAITSLRAGTITEADYTGYGTRPAITWGAAANTSPTGGRQRANTNLISMPTNGGADSFAIAWGAWSAATGGVLKAIGFLDAKAPIVGLVDDISTETILAAGHGMANDQRVFCMAAPGAVLPAGLAENTAYFVVSSATDSFKVSTTQGGAAVNITAKGAALFMPYTSQTIAAGATPQLAIGAVVSQL